MAFFLARTLAMIAAMLPFVVAKIQIECIWKVDYIATAVKDPVVEPFCSGNLVLTLFATHQLTHDFIE
jgi:hypothetical protein